MAKEKSPKHVKGAPRNYKMAGGVERFGRGTVYKMRGLYKKKMTAVKVAKAELPKTKTVKVGGAKNGDSRTVARTKDPRYTLAEVRQLSKHRSQKFHPTKLRASITPGTILILVAGPYRGKRVVFLKQLESGLLLVTGPYSVNKVPIRRVNQVYVIATSTKINMSGVDTAKFTDAYFAKKSTDDKKQKEFFEKEGEAAPKAAVTEERKADQKALDEPLLKAIQAVPNMAAYLGSSFTLRKGLYPHSLKF